MKLTDNLSAAWHDRARRAAEEWQQAKEAPALWTPERVAQLEADFHRAQQWARVWALEGLS